MSALPQSAGIICFFIVAAGERGGRRPASGRRRTFPVRDGRRDGGKRRVIDCINENLPLGGRF